MRCPCPTHLARCVYVTPMRLALILAVLPLPAIAWEFSPDPICTLTHQAQDAEIAITYDVRLPEYALFITLRTGRWPASDTFGMAFVGPRAGKIGTSQQTLSADGATLTVRDRGFGNVLDGLEFNDTAIAASGDLAIAMSLADAPEAVRAFRDCPRNDPPLS